MAELIAMTIAFTEIVKQAFADKFPTRFAPILAVGIGILVSLAYGYDWREGLLVGLTSTGLYKATDKMLNK